MLEGTTTIKHWSKGALGNTDGVVQPMSKMISQHPTHFRKNQSVVNLKAIGLPEVLESHIRVHLLVFRFETTRDQE